MEAVACASKNAQLRIVLLREFDGGNAGFDVVDAYRQHPGFRGMSLIEQAVARNVTEIHHVAETPHQLYLLRVLVDGGVVNAARVQHTTEDLTEAAEAGN